MDTNYNLHDNYIGIIPICIIFLDMHIYYNLHNNNNYIHALSYYAL